LANSYSKLIETGEVTNARFKERIVCADERGLALLTGTQYPFDDADSALIAALSRDSQAGWHPLIRDFEAVIRFSQGAIKHMLRKGARGGLDHGVGHAGLGMQPCFGGVTGSAFGNRSRGRGGEEKQKAQGGRQKFLFQC
jgi:hypothetical protein